MPTCSFMSKRGRVTFGTKPKKCKPAATTNTHKLSTDHRSKQKADEPVSSRTRSATAKKRADATSRMAHALPMNMPSARATKTANRARQRNLGMSNNY